MTMITAICISFLLLIYTISAASGGHEKHKLVQRYPENAISTIPEDIQFSWYSFSAKSGLTSEVNDTDDVRFWPMIIRARKRREVNAVQNEGEGGAKLGLRRQKKRDRERRRERERKRNKVKEKGGKNGRKREPLTRHARRPQRKKVDGGRKPHKARESNRGRPRHERIRNLEKQYLVRNRTLELLDKHNERDLPVKNDSDFFSPVQQSVRDAIFDRRITSKKIGEILGDGRKPSTLRISDLLVQKTLPKIEGPSIKARGKSVNISGDEIHDPPLFLEKLKTIAVNVSKMNKTVKKLRTADPAAGGKSDLEISTDFDESSYHYDYENVFEDPSVSPWVNSPRTRETVGEKEDPQEYFLDRAMLSSVYMPIDDQVTIQEGLTTLLARLFQTLRNATDDENQELLQDLDFDNSVQDDLCQKWLDCKDKLEEAFLGPLVLPACPCHYPSSIFYDDKIFDEGQQRHFRWRDVSGEAERLDVYKPGATYCIRSLLAQGGGSAAAQHCCYDGRRRLITRGSGAGTPNFVSPEVSALLHERIDILPWRLCKGDFSRFNKVRPPNNDNHCRGNPDEEEYQRQIDATKHY